MAMDAHLAELSEKHRKLEATIREEMTHPSCDTVKLAELKRKKLRIKYEINKLEQSVH